MKDNTNPFHNAIVLTVAGGLRPQDMVGHYDKAAFSHPTHAVEDLQGNILVSDTLNHKIKKITPAFEVEPFAGAMAGCMDGDVSVARFSEPTYMAVAKDNSVYISDSFDRVIRRIVGGCRVETAAGTPKIPYLEIGRDYVFTIDHRGRIDYTPEEWDLAKKDFSLDHFLNGPREFARFREPAGLALTSEGELLIVDATNSVIRILDNEGLVRTFAGKLRSAYSQEPTSQDGKGEEARFRHPMGICPDGHGAFLVTDRTNPGIRRVDLTGRVNTLFRDLAPSVPEDLQGYVGIARDASGNIFMSCAGQNRIACRTVQDEWFYLGDTLPGYFDGLAQDARFSRPLGLSLDSNGNLLVVDSDNHAVRRVLLAPSPELLARLPASKGSDECILFEAEMGSFGLLSRKIHPSSIESWQEMLGKRITFVEKADIDEILSIHLDGSLAKIRGIGDDPTPYFANDSQGFDFHLFPDHVVGQTIHGLRLHYTEDSVEKGTVERLKFQFSDGGFQYLNPVAGYGFELMASISNAVVLPEARAMRQIILAVERPSNYEISFVLDKGKLTLRSIDREDLELLSSNCECGSQVLASLDEVPNPFQVAKGLVEEVEFIFSIAVPQASDEGGFGPDNERIEKATRSVEWASIDPSFVVGQKILVMDLPLALPHDPIGGYVLMQLDDHPAFLLVRTKGAGLMTSYQGFLPSEFDNPLWSHRDA